MLFETPATPMPAAILDRTMEKEVKNPIARGPIISVKGRFEMT